MAEVACCLPSNVLLCTLLMRGAIQRQVEARGARGVVLLRKPFCPSPLPPVRWLVLHQASRVMMQICKLWAKSGRAEGRKSLELLLQL